MEWNFKSAIKTTLLALAIVFGLIGLALFFVVPWLVSREVAKEDHLGRTGNNTYNIVMEKFRAPKYSIQLQIWTYSVENAERVVSFGEKPSVIEKGPYTFVEVTEKRWFNFTASDTRLLYRNTRNYTYSQELSCLACDPATDMVMVPNILLQKLVDAATESRFFRVAINAVVKKLQEGPFLQVSVQDLLFDGYEDKLIKTICQYDEFTKIACAVLQIPLKIGLLYGQNNSDDGLYEIDTGLNNFEDLGRVYSWNGMTKLNGSHWYGEQARMINGTDGELFKPGLKAGENLQIFTGQACRSLDLEHTGYSSMNGVHTYRYQPSSSMQNVPLQKALGFCNPATPLFFNDTHVQEHGCAPSGLLDIGTCVPGKPSRILVSQSHFFNCPNALWQAIDGMKEPSASDDSTYVDIEPISGVVVRAKRRSQVSLGVTAGKLEVFSNLPNVIVPMIMMDESALIDADTMGQVLRPINALRDSFYGALAMSLFATFLLVAFAGITLGERIIERRNPQMQPVPTGPGGYDPLVESDDEEEESGSNLPGIPSPTAPPAAAHVPLPTLTTS